MSSHEIQSPNQFESTSSDSNATYKNSPLHRRVQSVIRAYHEEISTEAFVDSKFNQPINSAQRNEKPTFERKAVSFCDQIRPSRTESKEIARVNKNSDFPDLAQDQSKTSRSDYSPKIERRDRDIYIGGRKLFLNGTESHSSTSSSFFQERQINTRLQDRVDEDVESILSFFRERLNQYEKGKLRRQGKSNLELTTNIHRRLLQKRSISRSTDDNKRGPSAESYEVEDEKNTEAEEQRRTSREDMDNLRLKLRENLSSVRHRIHSSKALLGKHYGHSPLAGERPQIVIETTSPNRNLISSASHTQDKIQIPERYNLLSSMTDDFKLDKTAYQSEMMEEQKSLKNGWAPRTTKFYVGSRQDPNDSPSLSTKIFNMTRTPESFSKAGNLLTLTDIDKNESTVRSPKKVPNLLAGTYQSPNTNSQKPTQPKGYPNVKSVTKAGSTAFNPFPSSTSDLWNDFASPISDFSSNVLVGTVKHCELSNDSLSSEKSARLSVEVEAKSVIKKVSTEHDRREHHLNHDTSDEESASGLEDREANSIIHDSVSGNGTRETTSGPKEIRRRASFLCGNNKHKSSKAGTAPSTLVNASDKSVSSSENSSTRGSSFSCDDPVPLTGRQSPTISKEEKGHGKKGKPRRSFIASFSRAKAANKEWRVNSLESEHGSERKRDQRMREWLNGGNASGEGTVQGCVMETVFYDTRPE